MPAADVPSQYHKVKTLQKKKNEVQTFLSAPAESFIIPARRVSVLTAAHKAVKRSNNCNGTKRRWHFFTFRFLYPQL